MPRKATAPTPGRPRHSSRARPVLAAATVLERKRIADPRASEAATHAQAAMSG
jgi:hypothetical protein